MNRPAKLLYRCDCCQDITKGTVLHSDGEAVLRFLEDQKWPGERSHYPLTAIRHDCGSIGKVPVTSGIARLVGVEFIRR